MLQKKSKFLLKEYHVLYVALKIKLQVLMCITCELENQLQ